jgi:hypothetical protein
MLAESEDASHEAPEDASHGAPSAAAAWGDAIIRNAMNIEAATVVAMVTGGGVDGGHKEVLVPTVGELSSP